MKIIVTEQLAHEGLLILEKDPRIELDVRLGLTREELLSVIGEYDAIVTRSATKVDKDILAAGKKLKLVARAGVGIDSVDVDYASARGIIVLNAPFGNTNSVAEHTLALLLSLCRNIPRADASLKKGEWKRSALVGTEIKGKVAGVVGLSKVGGRVATRLQAFECEVIGCDPYISEKRAQDLGVKLVTLEELFRTADIITLHIPMTAETRDLIGEKELAAMKDGVIIINTARGGIVNEEALLKGLQEGKVGGAAVDVWSEEPPRSDRVKALIAHQRVVSMPHLGASTKEAQINVSVDVAREIIRYLDEQPLENAVNIPRFDLSLMDQMRPFLKLVNIMGEFVVQLLETNMNKITFTYEGNIANSCTTPITVCGFSSRQETINAFSFCWNANSSHVRFDREMAVQASWCTMSNCTGRRRGLRITRARCTRASGRWRAAHCPHPGRTGGSPGCLKIRNRRKRRGTPRRSRHRPPVRTPPGPSY
ncbi:MAG: phosphoglycerate dehydrogenase [Deltaproteobacteria bacterium]